MPVSCNLNGFQMAKVLGTFGPNLLSVSLYIIFLFSCLGMILLVLILLKKPVEIKYDWVDLMVIEISFVFFVLMY